MNMEGNIAVADSLIMGIAVVIVGMIMEPLLLLLGGLIIGGALVASMVESKKKDRDLKDVSEIDAAEKLLIKEKTA